MSDETTTGDPVRRPPLGTWGPLQLLEEIGRGGFGTVYRAWESVLDRQVALKVIRPRKTNQQALQEVLREGQLLAKIRHTNVVTVHGALQVGEEFGLWMEFVRGRSLADLVSREGRRASSEAANIGIHLCQALAAVHQAGVIHRDVKAQNVMREDDGRIVLMDFGAGQLLRQTGAVGDHAIGTPAYMAPEVMLGRPASVASDIYSLGVLLYYLVTGTFPIEGKSWSDFLIGHARGDRRPIGDIRPDVPADFARVVDKATARLPEERFQTPGALLTALSETMPKLVTPPAPVTAPEPETVSTSEGTISIDRRLLLAGLAVAGIWGLGAITSIVFNHTLGRSGEFATESILSWWVWGFRALIPGTVYVVMVLLAVWAARALWRLITRTVPPARRAADSGTFFIQRFSERTGFNTPSALAEALLIFQVIAVVAFCWYFVDIFSAMASFVETASAEDLEPMRPDHRFRHQIYGQSMAMLILAMAVGIQLVRRWQRIRGFAPSMKPFRANLAAMAVAFVVLVLPYRLMWQNRVEVAVYQDMRCYILADSGPAVRLYCPTSAVPRTRRVAQVDPTFTRTGQVENLYTRPTSSIPGR